MAHYYWSIVCKTERCGFRHLISYMGEHLSGQTFIARPAAIHFDCDVCGEGHDYTEDEIRMFPAQNPPPQGWRPIF